MKQALKAAVVGLGFAFAAGTAMADGDLHIYNWGNYTSPDMIKKFEEKYKVKVTIDDYDSNDAMLAKVKAGELVNFVAQQVGGKGGGKPDLAMAGGTDAAGVPAALASVAGWVRGKL